ncbi:MAG: hypothetical protein RR614_02585 [Eubacterium sp.]
MKKKASFLISGITTVALVAAAVGSFAAWDTLTGTEQTFSATSGSPATLNVASTPFDAKTLVPEGAVLGTNDVETLSGTFTATLSPNGKETGSDIKLKADPTVTLDTAPDTTVLETLIYKVGDSAKTAVTTDTVLESGQAYQVEVTYKDSAAAITNADTAGKAIAVKLECVATAK